jgi:hypothetical protein
MTMITMTDGSGETNLRDASGINTMTGTMTVNPPTDAQDLITTMTGRMIMVVASDIPMTMTDVGISAPVLEADHRRTAKSGSPSSTRATSGILTERRVWPLAMPEEGRLLNS